MTDSLSHELSSTASFGTDKQSLKKTDIPFPDAVGQASPARTLQLSQNTPILTSFRQQDRVILAWVAMPVVLEPRSCKAVNFPCWPELYLDASGNFSASTMSNVPTRRLLNRPRPQTYFRPNSPYSDSSPVLSPQSAQAFLILSKNRIHPRPLHLPNSLKLSTFPSPRLKVPLTPHRISSHHRKPT